MRSAWADRSDEESAHENGLHCQSVERTGSDASDRPAGSRGPNASAASDGSDRCASRKADQSSTLLPEQEFDDDRVFD